MIAHPKRGRLAVALGGGWRDVLAEPPEDVALIGTIAQGALRYAVGLRYSTGETVVLDAAGAPVALAPERVQAALEAAFKAASSGR